MKIIKNKINLFVLMVILCFSVNAFGATLKAPQSTAQKDALNRMEILGAIDKLSNSSLDISKTLRRDEFAKMIIISAGLQDTADSLKYQSIFPDVKTSNKMVGYVNASVNKGLMSGMADRKFHPEQNITLAQFCTAAVKALGYADSDLKGIWPQNYIAKAKALKLLDGITLKNNDGVTRGTAAIIIDRLLNTYVKKTSAQDADKTLVVSGGYFTDCIILGNPSTSDRLDDNQILTDQGIFYTTDSSMKFAVGNKYRVLLDGDKIQKIYFSLKTLKNVVISSVNDTKITYKENNAKANMTLPDKVVYYYNGTKQTYDNIKSILPGASSIIFAYNNDKIGYEYGVVLSNDAGSTGGYGDYIVLGDSNTMDKLENNQVLTDKGILYLDDNNLKLQIGNKYRLLVDNDRIKNVQDNLDNIKSITVKSVNGATIMYNDNGKDANMTLPDKVAYYYQGVKQTYDNLKNILQGDSTIIIASNNDNIGYEYAVIVDPIYSKPVIAANVKNGDKKVGNINLTDGESIVKNGDFINLSDIENGDVVYEISDLSKTNKYILVIENNIGGAMTGILPNRLYPKTIQIDSKSYDISDDMNTNVLSSSNSMFKIDDSVEISLGYDGKVVNITYPGMVDNSNYAMVINYSSVVLTDTSGNAYTIYNAKLLKTDGTTVTCKVDSDAVNLKGKLVTYNSTDGQIYTLTAIPYISSSEMIINKDDMQIGNSYVAENAKIFDIIANDYGVDANVKILNWSDLHSGTIDSGKVLYLNQAGEFGDANVLVLDDALNEKFNIGIIKSVDYTGRRGTPYTLNINVDGKDYTYSYAYSYANFSQATVKIVNGQITSLQDVRNADVDAAIIQAIDLKRIKLNNNIYKFSDNMSIYYRDSMGNVTVKQPTDIDITKVYGKVSLYFDKPLSDGGRVRTMVIVEQ